MNVLSGSNINNNIPWYESWFNSPYYHILYKHRDDLEAEHFLSRLINYLKPVAGSRILDLACGKGRHSVYLNEKGFEVTGIDLSPESISYCMQFENEKLSFFVHDMRQLFRVNDFDYVFNLFTSFGYFENEKENEDALKNACVALKKDGKLVIDFFNSNCVIKNLIPAERVVHEGIEFNIERRIEKGCIIKEITLEDSERTYHFTEQVTLWQLNDFEKCLTKNNMKFIDIFGDYELNQFNEEHSPRLIIVAAKS